MLFRSLLVTLEHDIRDDDLQSIRGAIRHIRFVAKVEPAPADNYDVHLAQARLRMELGHKLWDVFMEETGGKGK